MSSFFTRLLGYRKLHDLVTQEVKESQDILAFKIRELKAMEILKPYFPEGYLFESNFSMSFQAVQHILNDISVYKPRHILEIGSGLSTQVISRFIELQGLSTQLVSVDDNGEWQQMLHISSPNTQLLQFPLIDRHPFSYRQEGKWFDIPADHPVQGDAYDMVIVDAPKGMLGPFSRLGFVDFIQGKTTADTVIFLDDAQREDEQQIARWVQERYPEFTCVDFNYRYVRLAQNGHFATQPG